MRHLFICLVLIGGCASPAKITRPGAFEGRRVALLPFSSQSFNVDSGKLVRLELFKKMKARGYELVDLDEVDGAMKRLGISEGGQMAAVEHQQVSSAINADFYAYGEVLEFSFKSAVALSQREVVFQVKLLQGPEGRPAYEGTGRAIESKAGADAAGQLVLDVAGKMAKAVKDSSKRFLPGKKLKQAADATDIIADVDLVSETRKAVRNFLRAMEESFR